eukprot:evm.model.NODE_35309_length_51595_cov_30.695145.8
MRALHKAISEAGLKRRLMPKTIATLHLPVRSLSIAESRATKDEEHAVSMVMLGPFRPRTYETRFAAIEAAAPVPVYTDAFSDISLVQSFVEIPTNTPV